VHSVCGTTPCRTGPVGARPKSRGTRGIARHAVRDVRCNVRDQLYADGRRLRSGSRHHGDHRQPLAACAAYTDGPSWSCCTPKRHDTNATMRYAVSVCRAHPLRASCSPSTRGCCASVVHVCKTYTFRLHSLRGFNIRATKFGKIVAAFRQIAHFSCIRAANLALCATVLRRM
jgi:hypothetical protein